jgi:hypothetical protein
METMGRMLNEYSAMFAGGGSGGGGELDKEKIKSMFEEQAESLGKKLDTAMEEQGVAGGESTPEAESPAESSDETPQEPADEAAAQDGDSEQEAEEQVMFGEVEEAAAETEEDFGVGEVTVEEIPVVRDAEEEEKEKEE